MGPSNLLVIMSDEHQARAMGCAGHDFVQTPHLDRLAARGTRFTNAYTPSPICVPARAAFATGQHVHQVRLWDNAMPYTGATPGWGHALQAAGVPVESIGKLHYRDIADAAGFDVEHIPMMVADGVGMVWASIRREEERVLADHRMLGDYIGPGTSKYTEYDAAVLRHTLDWLRQRVRELPRPWCLYVGLVAPHFPLVVDQEFFDLYPLADLPPVKLHPKDGFARHPWVEKQNAFMDMESKFVDAQERLRAMAAYYGLCTWLDHNIGQIIATLGEEGLLNDTIIVYTSVHGDNVGARGLWGKSNMYDEAAAVPLIIAGPGVRQGTCDTPVSLIDISETILDHFGAELDTVRAGASLYKLAAAPTDTDRSVLSEYHASGSVSGAFMLRRGNWKYIHYVGYPPELFDLRNDPEETRDLAGDPAHRAVCQEMAAALNAICDPQAVDTQAFADQAAMIAGYGGREASLKLGAPAATPPPEVSA